MIGDWRRGRGRRWGEYSGVLRRQRRDGDSSAINGRGEGTTFRSRREEGTGSRSARPNRSPTACQMRSMVVSSAGSSNTNWRISLFTTNGSRPASGSCAAADTRSSTVLVNPSGPGKHFSTLPRGHRRSPEGRKTATTSPSLIGLPRPLTQVVCKRWGMTSL